MNIYLASPYSHDDEKIRESRFDAACKKAAEIMMQGHNVFSPIAHSHHISLHAGNSFDHEFWLSQDMSFLEHWADEMWILTLPEWSKSKGIAKEILFAQSIGISISLVNP